MGLFGSRPSSRMLAVLALVATTALWGASYPMIKQLIDVFPPCTLGVLRLAIALAVLLPVLLLKGGRPCFGRASVLLGITGVAAFQLFQNYGMERMPAGSAVIVLFGSSVVFTMVLGCALLGERCSTPMVVALIGSGAGVVLVTIGSGGAIGFPLVGLALMLASALAWSVFAIIGRKSMGAGDLSEINVAALIVGLVLMLPFAAYERPDTRDISVSANDLFSLVVLGAVVTAGTYFFWSYSIRHLQANEASVLCSIEPAFGLVFAWLLLQEGISMQETIGAAVIVASCVLVARGERVSVDEPLAIEPEMQGASMLVAL